MEQDPLSGAIHAIASQLEESEYLGRQIDRGRRRLWVLTALRTAAWALDGNRVRVADAAPVEGGARIVVATDTRIVEVTAIGDIENDMPPEEPVVSVRVLSCLRLAELETAVKPIIDPHFGVQGFSVTWLRVRNDAGDEVRLPLDPTVWQSRRGYSDLADAWRAQVV